MVIHLLHATMCPFGSLNYELFGEVVMSDKVLRLNVCSDFEVAMKLAASRMCHVARGR
jgi:hypothetical protein